MRNFIFILILFLFFNFNVDDSFNRRVYSFNRGFDQAFLDKSLSIYIKIVPTFLDNSISNFIKNMSEIQNIFFYFFLLEYDSINKCFFRFTLNSYFGFLGFLKLTDKDFYVFSNFDYNSYLLRKNSNEFVYMMLPLIGPSTLNFNISLILSHFLNPFFYFSDKIIFYYFFELLSKKSYFFFDGNFFHSNMLDGYLFLKDIYIQNNQNLLNDGYDFLFDPPD